MKEGPKVKAIHSRVTKPKVNFCGGREFCFLLSGGGGGAKVQTEAAAHPDTAGRREAKPRVQINSSKDILIN